MNPTTPNFSEFRRLARQGTVVPIYRTVVADMLSPVSAFLKLAPEAFNGAGSKGKGGSHHSFLLESVEGGERVGRYTYFGVDPFQVITCRGNQIMLVRGRDRAEESGNIFEYLRRIGSKYRSVKLPGLPPFSAGAVGYLSYEAVRQLERLPARVEPDVDTDDAIFMYFRTVVAFDHVRHRLFLIANVLTEEDPGNLRQKYDHAVRELDRLERKLARPLRLPNVRAPKGALRVKPNMTRKRYEEIVDRGKE